MEHEKERPCEIEKYRKKSLQRKEEKHEKEIWLSGNGSDLCSGNDRIRSRNVSDNGKSSRRADPDTAAENSGSKHRSLQNGRQKPHP